MSVTVMMVIVVIIVITMMSDIKVCACLTRLQFVLSAYLSVGDAQYRQICVVFQSLG